MLRRLARDAAVACEEAGGRPEWIDAVEAVVPRRVADFKAVFVPGAPAEATDAVVLALSAAPWVRRCVGVPPHAYFDVRPERLDAVLRDELCRARGFGRPEGGAYAGRDVALAYCSPNANKPLHVGHARNLFLGGALANMLQHAGARVFRSLCLSDYGIHIFKAAAQYLREGAGATPESAGVKGDHFVGGFYARYGTGRGPRGSMALRAEDLSRLWMTGDPAAVELTRRIAAWAEQGFRETFDAWGARFDHWFRETEEQPYIDAFVAEQAARGTLTVDGEGRHVVELEGGPVPLLRSDGSTLYMSHMVAAILQRAEFLGPRADVLMSLTAQEQIPAFGQLGEILRRFGYADRVEVRHVWHGLVTEGGEKMASRDGAAPTLDDVYAALCDEVAARVPAALAPAFARGALRLYLLGRPARKPLDFSLARCAAEGGAMIADVARALRATAAGEGRGQSHDGPLPRTRQEALGEWRLRLAAYPAVLDRATRELDPSLLVRWLADVCGGFGALHRALRGADGAVPAELGRLHLPLRRTVDHALGLLDAREVEYEMLAVERGAAPGRRPGTARPAGAAA